MSKNQQKLLALIQALPEQECQAAIHYIEYLAHKASLSDKNAEASVLSAEPETVEIQQPLDIPRPETETVVAAIKRLSKTYSMLDKAALLSQASTFMTQHIMQGRDAKDVIDELEDMFKQRYVKFTQDLKQPEQVPK